MPLGAICLCSGVYRRRIRVMECPLCRVEDPGWGSNPSSYPTSDPRPTSPSHTPPFSWEDFQTAHQMVRASYKYIHVCTFIYKCHEEVSFKQGVEVEILHHHWTYIQNVCFYCNRPLLTLYYMFQCDISQQQRFFISGIHISYVDVITLL